MTHALRPWPGDQDPDELAQFLDFVVERKVKSYLEIGSRNGDLFYAVMMAIGPGAFGMAIDLPENASSKKSLLDTMKELNAAGRHAIVNHGNSQDRMLSRRVELLAPYDLVLIDADHTYDGVRGDWETYSPMAPIVALHDVAAPDGYMSDGRPNEVGRFWKELTLTNHVEADLEQYRIRHTFAEIISPGSVRGFGIVIK